MGVLERGIEEAWARPTEPLATVYRPGGGSSLDAEALALLTDALSASSPARA